MNETITWIPVSERLPDDDATVLICCHGGFVQAGWYESRQKHWFPFVCRLPATHWAEWPKGPDCAIPRHNPCEPGLVTSQSWHSA